MAFEKLLAFTKDVSDFADRVTGNPAEIKAQFDAAPDEVRQYLNKLIDALKSTATGDSGAKNTGATAITGLTGTDVQSLLEGLKSYTDQKKLAAQSNNSRFEVCAATFFTNGGSNNATANVNFAQAFTTAPVIFPANITQSASYADTIRYPYISNVTTTGFTVKITTADVNNLGTGGSPSNIFMNFLAIGN